MMLADIVIRMRGKRIYVLGDGIVDEYIHGKAARLSPEAPVPVFVEESRESRPGGAANVVNQLEALGCVVLKDMAPFNCWSRKSRYMAGGHQLLRVDADIQTKSFGPALFSGINAAVISDYAKGWVGVERCLSVIEQAGKLGVPVVVDPKGDDWGKYSGCSVICPNELEAKDMPALMFSRVLFKRGAAGMWLDDNGRSTVIAAKARKVFDVTGAGDTVVAVMAAALAAGADYVQAAVLANYAASYVVGELGTVACPGDWLFSMAQEDDRAQGIDDNLLACYTAP
jgi:D-beta-D-heptose 7-phosphate kinase/D-beta-D-heptose 1-phosphate adenosyltransferase